MVLPTRELALQVDESLRRVGHGFGLKTAVLIGGLALGLQIHRSREKSPHYHRDARPSH